MGKCVLKYMTGINVKYMTGINLYNCSGLLFILSPISQHLGFDALN